MTDEQIGVIAELLRVHTAAGRLALDELVAIFDLNDEVA